jgi:hypothetical protein
MGHNLSSMRNIINKEILASFSDNYSAKEGVPEKLFAPIFEFLSQAFDLPLKYVGHRLCKKNLVS